METALDIGRKSNRYNKNCQPSNNNNKEKWFRTLLHFTFLYEIYSRVKKQEQTKIENEQGKLLSI